MICCAGSNTEVAWAMTDAGLKITPPEDLGSSEHAWSFEIATTMDLHVPSAIEAKASEALKGTRRVDLEGNSPTEKKTKKTPK